MSMSKRFTRLWITIVAYVIIAIAVLVLPLLRAGDTRDEVLGNVVLALGGLVIVSIVFGVLLLQFRSTPLITQAQTNGLPAAATVLKIGQTGWRRREARGRLRVRQGGLTKHSDYDFWEYRVDVRVEQVGKPPYEAVIFQLLKPEQAPSVDDHIAVKIHPQRADIVVINDTEPVSRA